MSQDKKEPTPIVINGLADMNHGIQQMEAAGMGELASVFRKAFDFPKQKIQLDYSLISEVQVEGIDTKDYPDFCDAFIASATYDGREMTEAELEVLNNDGDFVYSQVEKRLY